MELEMPLLVNFPLTASLHMPLETVDALTVEEATEWCEQLLSLQQQIKKG